MTQPPGPEISRKTARLLLLALVLVHANVATWRVSQDAAEAGHEFYTANFENAVEVLDGEEGSDASLPGSPSLLERFARQASRTDPPLTLALDTAVVAAVGQHWDSTFATTLLLTVIAAFGCYGIARRMHGRLAGLLAAALFLAAPHVMAVRLRPEEGLATAALTSLGLAVLLASNKLWRVWWCVGFGVCWGLLAWVNPITLCCLFLPFLYVIGRIRADTGKEMDEVGKRILLTFVFAVLVALPVFLQVDREQLWHPVAQETLEGALSLYFASLTHPPSLAWILLLTGGVVLAIVRLQETPWSWMALNLVLTAVWLMFFQLPLSAGLVTLALAAPLAVVGILRTLETMRRPERHRRVLLWGVAIMVLAGWMWPLPRLNPVLSETWLAGEIVRAVHRLAPAESLAGLAVGTNSGLLRERLAGVEHPLNLAIQDGRGEGVPSRPEFFVETNPHNVEPWGDYVPAVRFPAPILTEPRYDFQWERERPVQAERLESFAVYRLAAARDDGTELVATPWPVPDFEGRCRLFSFRMERQQVSPGDVLAATAVWEINAAGVAGLESYLHLRTDNAQEFAVNFPFRVTAGKRWLVQAMRSALPADLAARTYEVHVGVWRPPHDAGVLWREDLPVRTVVVGEMEVGE